MKSYDNNGKLVSEINRSRTADGTSITTNTMYNTHNGQVASQNIAVQDSKTGKVTSTNIINGKLLP
jgi:phage-related protein